MGTITILTRIYSTVFNVYHGTRIHFLYMKQTFLLKPKCTKGNKQSSHGLSRFSSSGTDKILLMNDQTWDRPLRRNIVESEICRDGSRISGKGVHMYKGVGVRFAVL